MENNSHLLIIFLSVLLAPLLNTTADISEEEDNTAQSVVRVEIADSRIDCVELSHFGTFHHLEEIKVTKSVLKQAFCSGNRVEHKKAAQQLKILRSLDLSFPA